MKRLLLLAVMVSGLAALAFWRWGGPLVALLRDQERIRAWLAGFGLLAPLVSILLNAAQVLLAPVPGQIISLANGYLFGVFWGTVYSMVGLAIGSALAMGIGRWLGRPAVERLVSPDALARWDGVAARRGPLFFFLVFLLPLLPDDVTCFVVGLSPLSIPYVLVLATLGRLPGLVAGSWLGQHAASLSPGGWALLVGATVALALLVLRYQNRIEAALLRLLSR